jgi:hypothetical protein
MVIDTSGLLAILLDEPERRAFNEAIEATPLPDDVRGELRRRGDTAALTLPAPRADNRGTGGPP